MKKTSLALLLFLISLNPAMCYPCSAFSYAKNGHILVGANTDACQKVEGLVIVNKRNLSKRGSSPGSTGQYASWVSKYGSITFTYCCRELAQYGMNEAGLVVTTVGLPGSQSPKHDERPPLDGNIWAQYILDNCSTIEEVIKTESDIRIVNDKDQYLICDRNGNTLIVECLDGKMVYYYNESLPIPVLTNEKYNTCLSNFNKNHLPQNDPYISNKRFRKGAKLFAQNKQIAKAKIINQAFNNLDNMSQHPCTQWNLVFDIKNRCIHFRSKQANKKRFINLDDFDFSCDSKMMELDVNKNISGNTFNKFSPYSSENNLNLMRKAFKTFGVQRTEKQLYGIIDFFDSYECSKY